MQSVTTAVAHANDEGTLRHMFALVGRHPFLSLGVATGLAFSLAGGEQAVRRRYYQPQAAPMNSPMADATQTNLAVGSMSRAGLGSQYVDGTVPVPVHSDDPGTMEGYEGAKSAYIQPANTGYDNGRLVPTIPPQAQLTPAPPTGGMVMRMPSRMTDVRRPSSMISQDAVLSSYL